jgi:hypothetical protein
VYLIEHQLVLGRCLHASGGSDASTLWTADLVKGFPNARKVLAELGALVTSPGFCFTRRIQRSWCIARTASATQLTLSLLPVEQRRRLIDDWVNVGGGRDDLRTSLFIAPAAALGRAVDTEKQDGAVPHARRRL